MDEPLWQVCFFLTSCGPVRMRWSDLLCGQSPSLKPVKCHDDTFLRRSGTARSIWYIMGSFQPANTLLLLAATVPSSWSFHLSNMFVGMMFSGVVLAKWSLSSRDMTLIAFNFNKLSISLNLGASNFSCPFPTVHHTPHHCCLWVWALPRKLVFRQ